MTISNDHDNVESLLDNNIFPVIFFFVVVDRIYLIDLKYTKKSQVHLVWIVLCMFVDNRTQPTNLYHRCFLLIRTNIFLVISVLGQSGLPSIAIKVPVSN